jgi:hypothetical protein
MSKEELDNVIWAIKTGDRSMLLSGIPLAIKGFEIAKKQRIREIRWYDAILTLLENKLQELQGGKP